MNSLKPSFILINNNKWKVIKMTLNELEQQTLFLHPNLDKNDVKLALMHCYDAHNYITYRQLEKIEVTPLKKYEAIIRRLLKGEPIQYILGSAYFYFRDFSVDKNVLIPRPETEELVHFFIGDAKNKPGVVLDVGTGSGVIAITIKHHTQHHVYASDISKKALKVARLNSGGYDITFLDGDLLKPAIKEGLIINYIVANLPYIKEEEILDNKVKSFEPHRALFWPKRNIFNRLFKEVKKLPKVDGGISLYLEYGTDQTEELTLLAKRHFGRDAKIEVRKDMQGKERFLIIRGIHGN
ncbi:MAG: HemK/PrmC family methyltransferase [Bacilli bacterium]